MIQGREDDAQSLITQLEEVGVSQEVWLQVRTGIKESEDVELIAKFEVYDVLFTASPAKFHFLISGSKGRDHAQKPISRLMYTQYYHQHISHVQ